MFRAQLAWSSRPAMGGPCTLLRGTAIAQTRHDTSDGAGRVAVGVVPTRAGREFRHGKRHAQPWISNWKRRRDARGDFPGASVIVPRHGLLRNSNANSPICHAHPPHPPFHSLIVRCCMASEWSCSLGPPPTPPPTPSQCLACGAQWPAAAWRGGTGVLSRA